MMDYLKKQLEAGRDMVTIMSVGGNMQVALKVKVEAADELGIVARVVGFMGGLGEPSGQENRRCVNWPYFGVRGAAQVPLCGRWEGQQNSRMVLKLHCWRSEQGNGEERLRATMGTLLEGLRQISGVIFPRTSTPGYASAMELLGHLLVALAEPVQEAMDEVDQTIRSSGQEQREIGTAS